MTHDDDRLDEEKLLPEEFDGARPQPTRQSFRALLEFSTPKCSLNPTGGLFVVNFLLAYGLLVFYLSIRSYKLHHSECSSNDYFSPILKDIDLPYHTQQVYAKLSPNVSDPMAIFSSPPSREVDHAWMHLSKNMIVGLTSDDINKLGKDPKTAVPFNPAWNIDGGEDLYVGVLDVFHQIHCLDMLRQNLIFNYEYYWGDIYGFKPPAFRETHLRHCTSILLQAIMCHADMGVVTHVWSEDAPVPFPDFAINRQCRNFQSLVEWRDEKDLNHSFSKFANYKVPAGVPLKHTDPWMAKMIATADEFVDGEYLKELHIKGCNAST